MQVSISEIIVAVNDSSLPEDVGCGACVDQLVITLDGVVPDIRNASLTLDSLVNQTQIQLLSGGISKLDVTIAINLCTLTCVCVFLFARVF